MDNLLRILKESNQRYAQISRRRVLHIDADIHSLGDLVKLVQTHGATWHDGVKCNIDISALVRIQDELEKLDAMVGLAKFKNAILDQLLYFLQNLHQDGEPDFLHTILCGPPGTGKTEIATLLGKMYAKLGILKNGIFKKVTRADLVGGYLGQTALKTTKVIEECLGGCLFIDEAYSLASSSSTGHDDNFSKECLDTLCEALSHHKAQLMVILAGYENDLDDTIFRTNRGLESRFIWRFVVDKYSATELRDMFLSKIHRLQWTIDGNLDVDWFERRAFPHFGRDMELLVSYTKCCHGRRIFGQSDALRKHLLLDDVQKGYDMLVSNRRQKPTYEIPGFYV